MYNVGSSPVLTKVAFTGNAVTNALSGGGGAIYNWDNSSPVLADCIFEDNYTILDGGGMVSANYSSPTLKNCLFLRNEADGRGGALFTDDHSSPRLTNSTLWGNVAENGAGMYSNSSAPTLINSIVWGNWPDQVSSEASTVSITYSDIQGVHFGEGNISADPLFVDAANGDFHLGPGSPCIDVGSNAAPDLPLYDFEGDDRVQDGDDDGTATVDMGVDEFAVAGPEFLVYLPLVVRGD